MKTTCVFKQLVPFHFRVIINLGGSSIADFIVKPAAPFRYRFAEKMGFPLNKIGLI